MGAGNDHRFLKALSLVAMTGAMGACTDSGEADTLGPPAVTVGSGSSTDATTGSSSTSSGTGGMGGAGTCLAGTPASAYFTVQTTDLCVVARYDAAALDLSAPYASPTWGQHGGPVTASALQTGTNADLHIARWTISGTTLTKQESTVPVTGLTNPAFFTGEILDLPTGDSVIGWQGIDFANDGGLFLTSGTTVKKAYVATGAFSFAALGPSNEGYVRVLYTGLSAVDGMTSNVPALYAADLHSDGSLVVPSAAVDAWGTANGPVAADSAGNVFAIGASTGTQEVRGFAATKIQPLTLATTGVTLLSTSGFGSELAAVAPKAALPGLVVLQPQMGAGAGEDVKVQRYTSDGTTLAASGTSETLLHLATAGTNLTLMTDPQGRLWVGAKNIDAGASGTSFFVLDRP